MKKFNPKVPLYVFPSLREGVRVSYGVNEQTRKALKKIALDCGWPLSGILTLCLDQFCQYYTKNPYSIVLKKQRRIRRVERDPKLWKFKIILKLSKPLLKRLDKIAKENEITRTSLIDHVAERMESINKISFL